MVNMRTKKSNWLIALVCAAIGFILGMITIGIDIETLAPEEENRYALTFLLSVPAGIIACALLPSAISHHPNEGPEFPGTRFALVSSVVVTALNFSPFAIAASMVAFISLLTRKSTPWTIAGVVAIVMGTVIDGALRPPSVGLQWSELLVGSLAISVVGLVVAGARIRKRDQHTKLITSTRQAERDRIARDMHDSISHRLSLISVHSGALAFRDLPPEKVKEVAGTIQKESEAAVQDLRVVLQTLRGDTVSPRTSVDELVTAARGAGQDIKYRNEATQNLTAERTHALTRAIQEGLTNARKHAPGEPVELHIADVGKTVTITMRNRLTGERGEGARQGLISLGERAQLAGGQFTHSAEGGVFTWTMSLPAESTNP